MLGHMPAKSQSYPLLLLGRPGRLLGAREQLLDVQVLVLAPWRLDAAYEKYLTGGDEDALGLLTVKAFSTNQPHTRAPFSNMLPDLFVIGDEFEWQGHGGVIAAGFFDEEWRVTGDSFQR